MADIRLLPMSLTEFSHQASAEVQANFFLDKLINERAGAYLYRTAALRADEGTLTLFQYANSVIAAAVYVSTITYDKPVNGYRGALLFDPASVEVFDPISRDEMREIWPGEFDRCSNAKQSLSAKRRFTFRRYRKNIRLPVQDAVEACDLPDAAARRTNQIVARIIRDTALSRWVKTVHEYRCQIRGCTASLERSDGVRYAEAHHIKPLGRDHNGPDIASNILCLCPNHHAECDLGIIQLSLDRISSSDEHRVSAEYLRYHNDHIYVAR